MSWLAGSNKVDHRAAFWYWQMSTEAYWLLSESTEAGDCYYEGWGM